MSVGKTQTLSSQNGPASWKDCATTCPYDLSGMILGNGLAGTERNMKQCYYRTTKKFRYSTETFLHNKGLKGKTHMEIYVSSLIPHYSKPKIPT